MSKLGFTLPDLARTNKNTYFSFSVFCTYLIDFPILQFISCLTDSVHICHQKQNCFIILHFHNWLNSYQKQHLLYILTSIWVQCTPKAGNILHFNTVCAKKQYDTQTPVFYLVIRQWSKDLKHLIPRTRSPGSQG